MDALRVIDLILEKESPEERLLNLGDFQSFALRRGIHLPPRETFELWDRWGLLRPVLKVRSECHHHRVLEWLPDRVRYDPVPLAKRARPSKSVIRIYSHWDPVPGSFAELRQDKGRLIDPSSTYFQDWRNFADGNGHARITFWYHPFQIERVREILKANHQEPERPHPTGRVPQAIRRQMKDSEPDFLRAQALVIAIEDFYLPRIRHADWRIGPTACKLTNAESRCAAVLSRIGLSRDDIKKIHWKLSWAWHELNDLGQWHELLRFALHESRRQLRGRLRLAWTYYEWAKMLELFLRDEGAAPLATEEIVEIGAPPNLLTANWRAEDKNPVIGLLRQFGLDPSRRIDLLVEGETEALFIRTWFEENGISLTQAGIELTNYHGLNGLKNDVVYDLMKQSNEQGRTLFLTVDAENDWLAQVTALKENGLIEDVCQLGAAEEAGASDFPAGAFVWQPCFEDANFTREELVDAYLATLERKQPKPHSLPARECLLQRMNEQYEGGQNRWIKALERVAGRSLRKPLIGAELARRFKEVERPITKLLRQVLRHVR